MLLPLALLSVSLLLVPAVAAGPSVSHIVDSLADVCLEKVRDSLCEPVQQLSSRLEAVLGALQPAPQQCPSGWSRHGSSCFIIPPQIATWLQAHHACAKLDRRARLGSVHPASQQHVKTLVAASDSDRVWIGLIRLPGRRWGWTDGSPLDYANWSPGNPSYGGEHCAHIYGPRNSLEGWNDTECDRERHFLCEIQLGQP